MEGTLSQEKPLHKYGENRRTWNKVKSGGGRLIRNPGEIYKVIHRNTWPYKTRQEFYHTRDRALAALLYLSSGRINEVLRLKKDQFIDIEDPDFMIIQGFWVSKRKAGAIHPTPDIPLPLKGRLSPFTELVLDYLSYLGPEEKLFKFTRARAWRIIRTITNPDLDDPDSKGWFPHWFRAQSLTYNVNLLRSTIVVAQMRGVENSATLGHYYAGGWQDYKDELKK